MSHHTNGLQAKEEHMSMKARRTTTSRFQRLGIPPELVVIGVDIGQRDNVAVAQFGDGREAKPLPFHTTKEGFEELKRYGEKAVREAGAEGLVFAMEPTGHYGAPLEQWLVRQDMRVFRVQPLFTNRAKELYDGTWRKTDAKDARLIAHLCRRGVSSEWTLMDDVYAELRGLSRHWQQVGKNRSTATNRLIRHLDEIFPELRGLFKDIRSRTLLELLKVAPTPGDIIELGLEELTKLIRRASRGKLGRERAEQVLEAARTTIGGRQGLRAHAMAIREQVAILEHTMAELDRIKKAMKVELAKVPYAKRLLSIPRLGEVTLAILLGEFGDLRNYRHSAQLIKMAGLDLVEVSSGKRRGKRHISRRGRAYARQILFLAALRLGNGVLKEPRRRMVEDNKVQPTKAAVANMRRLLRILHAMVRDDANFDATRHAPKGPEERMTA